MSTDQIRQKSADESLKHSNVTNAIIRSFYDVYNELGQGFLESVYREAMALVLRTKGLTVQQERTTEVRFRGQVVGVFRTDLVVENVVIVELKVARLLDSVHEAQLLNYLKATRFEVGLLLNFGNRPQFRRMRLDNDLKAIRENPCKSVVEL
jgi:GxxExxY protein